MEIRWLLKIAVMGAYQFMVQMVSRGAAYLSSPMGQEQILSTFTGASRQGLSHKDLGLIRIPFTSLQIQHATVSEIESKNNIQGKICKSIELQIETLTAYRKSLIHECVTGQRRVTEEDVAWVEHSQRAA